MSELTTALQNKLRCQMTVAKFQHYVPRFYLARFVDQEGFILVFDKMNERTFRLKPENIAGQNRFYDLHELEQYGVGRNLMKQQFAGIESEAQKISGDVKGDVVSESTYKYFCITGKSSEGAGRILRDGDAKPFYSWQALLRGGMALYQNRRDLTRRAC